MTEPLPVTILTGFLGSGKTTLLRRLVASPAFNDTAVVVNELGEIALDHHLVETALGPVVELPGGCLCCAVREDLAQALQTLLEKRDCGELKPFRRLAIETTGLADPAPILFTLAAEPFLDARLALAGVTTLVDAVLGAETLERFAEAARQVALADRIFVTKTDLVPFSRALEAGLDRLNPIAPRFFAGAEKEDEALLLAPSARGFDAASDNKTAPPPAAHSHGIDSFALFLEGPIERLQFAQALGALAAARGSDLLRVKGILAFSDRTGGPAFIQGAQHALYPPQWLEGWPDGDTRNRLQFIVHEIAREEVLGRFAFAAPHLGAQA